MIKFECKFECVTEQAVRDALQEIMNRLDDGYSYGHLCFADGSWSYGKTEDEEDRRTIEVEWNVPDSEWETFVNEGVPRIVDVPVSIENDAIADWLYSEYGYDVEYFEDLESGEVIYP